MIRTVRDYLTDLTDGVGDAWNQFWFTPSSVLPLCGLRILVGMAAIYLAASYTGDLTRWFGRDGLLGVSTVKQLTGETPDARPPIPLEVRTYLQDAGSLSILHFGGLAVLAAFTAGLFTRVTSVLSLAVVLSYLNRAPMLTGPFEPIVAMLLFYLCLAPAGACWSLDAWRRRRAGLPAATTNQWTATVALRLMQVHLAAFYVVMGLTKLGGVHDAPYDATWWRGQAIWWLVTRTETRLVDLTFLHQTPMLVNLLTYAVLAVHLAFPIAIWNRRLRPLMLFVASLVWLLLAPITGLVSFCLIMLVAHGAFVAPCGWEAVCGRCCGKTA